MDKNRLSRWSRLKSKGGASLDEDDQAQQVHKKQLQSPPPMPATDGTATDEFAIIGAFPENKFKRPAVPVMAPLAGVEDGDSEFEAPPEAALAMINGQMAHDPEPGANAMVPLENAIEEPERDLTPEETEYVATLPAVETLTNESDFTPFMSEKVPEFLRRKALRVLYQSHPILGFRDGLNDYDHDYNLIDTLIDAATQTSYKVGKGQKAAQEIEDPLEEPDQTKESHADADNTQAPDSDGDPEALGNPDPAEQADQISENEEQTVLAEEEVAAETDADYKPEPEHKSIRDVRKPE